MIAVWAVAGARDTRIAGAHGDALKVRVAAAPEQGRANAAIARLLADAVGMPVELVAGATTRRKRYLVRGLAGAQGVACVEEAIREQPGRRSR